MLVRAREPSYRSKNVCSARRSPVTEHRERTGEEAQKGRSGRW